MPECSLTIVATPPPTTIVLDVVNVSRDEKGTVTLNDDSFNLTLTVSAKHASSGWTSNIPVPGQPGTFYTGEYDQFYPLAANVSELPLNPTIRDRADQNATAPVTQALPSPGVYVLGELRLATAATSLIPSAPGISTNNVWKNMSNGVLTQTDGSSAFVDGILDVNRIEIHSDALFFPEGAKAIEVTADLIVSETGPSSNFEADDTFKARIWWQADGVQAEGFLTDAFDSNGDEQMNGFNDTVALPYDSNKLMDEFNRPAPGVPRSGSISNTFKLKGTIPAGAQVGGIDIIGMNDSGDEHFVLQNLTFTEVGASPASDNDGDGVSNADEDIMGTDKFDVTSVLRISGNPANPSEFTFTGVPGRYYKVYRTDDAADATHLQKWVDNGTPSTTGIGPHSFQVSHDPGESRRYYRVHVMQTDGPWPAAYP